ncbi:MAG: flagellar motor protein [bacterium]|nr:flagellar motor protein [bacterium]
MNISALLAVLLSIVAVVSIQAFEGGSISMLIQPVAFIIVIGGTFCAAILNFNFDVLKTAIENAKSVFKTDDKHALAVVDDVVQLSVLARKHGLFSLQSTLPELSDSFLARAMQLAIDMNNPQMLYDILAPEIAYEEEEELASSRVFEALGGYAPTFGVVGAVLGLIQVMSNISDLTLLGHGIAIAFVATLYGVGFANLILLPIAGNLKQKTREKILLKEVTLQGVMSIVMQENPAIIEEKLVAYLKFHNKRV